MTSSYAWEKEKKKHQLSKVGGSVFSVVVCLLDLSVLFIVCLLSHQYQ